ncbi:uncharacterized protein LOC129566529 [Sitodiplosis mosellana]|uniref:uncharacterized protein LOC129566529 n=1 Tax=Sitodiplosis mosellana TaxID=263140 RepID=UPI002444E3F0|nr:uncharacterized protein LOC129566529 [Sitodiplosis mosellana]XP_055298545.1 uncharacterized protein LOC129566529 [Sitodiplosis mosellana]
MVRLGLFAICLVLAFGYCSAKAIDSNVKVAVVHNLTTFLSENPDVKLLQPLIKEQLGDVALPKLQINYRLGNRISGDRLSATAGASNQWSTPQNVKLTLAYPRSGVGNVVTYVQVIVEQSTNLGRGYVTSGGIGQRQVTIIIEAQSTLYFKYNAEIFGY